MPTQSQDRKVQEARRKLDELREEAHRINNDYLAHLGELVCAVDANDEPSVTTSFDGAFAAGARLRDILEEYVAGLLEVLAPVDHTAKNAESVCKSLTFYVGRAYSLL